ncbi:4-hydroxybenzoate 3-monooxygenase [Gordonia sp. (in: high G+C Gram-positive bacteria)]|uniref:4-hydroxybenzoate 3-monooxygenase n=1 Tax=Gordonia sp. (in: high G+C Gram-positive bacteria) TaxID=84139 RepID=UPI0039E540AC
MLLRQGIDAIVLEQRDEAYVRARVRAGVLEQTTVDVLDQLGLADRLYAEALRHDGFYLRFDRSTHKLDFHADTGRNAWVYGQAEVVADLIDDLKKRDRPVVFEAADVSVDGYLTGRPEVAYTDGEGRRRVIEADFVAGCDGFHGVCRATVADRIATAERSYPFAWLGILAHSTPVTAEGMYTAHPDGLAVHSMRGPHITRQYLQVPADTDLDAWSDERIWAELRRRSAADDWPELETGEVFEKSLAPLRSLVSEPMRVGSLFLLGDAAHIVPPTGAKGLNLAVSDACVFSHAVGGFYATGRKDLLDAYSDTALDRVWQAQAFSWNLTSMLHRFDDDGFDWPLRRARLQRLVDCDDDRRAIGHVYLGLPFPTAWRYE